jgi:hypothetical protein
MKEHHYKGKIGVVAHNDDEEDLLTKEGADYVLRPFVEAAEVVVERFDD